jgi:hypothetical protein
VKTIVERTVVTLPREKTEFVCDHCDFRDHSANIVREHEANEHLVKAKLEVDYLTLYHFDSEANAQAWLEIIHGGFSRKHLVEWQSPGWYTLETWTEPCPRGCCRDHCVKLTPIESLCEDLIYQARDIMHKVTKIRQAVKGTILA